jgi:hypothetical protein
VQLRHDGRNPLLEGYPASRPLSVPVSYRVGERVHISGQPFLRLFGLDWSR